MIESSIENNLNEYIRKIDDEGRFNKHDEKIRAEDFFRRIFELIYGWDSLVNLNYTETNSPGIDLYEIKKGIAVQITAIQSGEKNKIEKDTIEKVFKYHKSKKINQIICFFIRDNKALKTISEKELSEKYKKKIIIKTTKQLIGDFEKIISPEKRIRIEEIVKQELRPEFNGIENINYFNPIEKIVRTAEYISPENTIYFSYSEKNKIKEIARKFNKNKIKEYSILGNPCSGKSTFARAIANNLIPYYRKYVLDLSDPSLNNSKGELLDALNQLSFYHTFVIIDNIQDNTELFKILRQKIINHSWLKGLYISRYHNSFREEDKSSIFNIFRGIQQYRYYQRDNEFEEKVSGIINNRIHLFKEEYPEYEWYKGNFNTILKNTNRNLLKLNIALETWSVYNRKHKNYKLDQIDNDRIYSSFYEAHNLRDFDKELISVFSFLYSFDISFLRVKGKNIEFRQLEEKGIILNYTISDYYYFPHRDYANLIFQAITKETSIEREELIIFIQNYLKNYIIEFNEFNIIEIIIKLYHAKQFDIVASIINTKEVKDYLKKIFTKNIRVYEVYELQAIFFNFFEQIKKDNQISYFELFQEYFSKNKLELYVYKDYLVYSNLTQLASILNREVGNIYHYLRINEQANTNSITELTMRISKKKVTPETIRRTLNSFDFPGWLSMIEELPTFARITNSLSELNTSPLSKRLLLGIINQLDTQKLATKAKKQNIDQIGKSIRELEKIDLSIGTQISQEILLKLREQKILSNKIKSSNLSGFSKSLSDLSSIAPDFTRKVLEDSFENNDFYNKLEKEKSISNVSARILEINQMLDDTGRKEFYPIINKYFKSEVFKNIIRKEENLNSLLITYDLLEKKEIKIDLETKTNSKSLIKKKILSSKSNYILFSNYKILNIPELVEKVKSEISSETINSFLKNSKFTIVKPLFTVLAKIDKEETIKSLNNADYNIFIKSMSHNELNISQSIDSLFEIKKYTFIDNNLNSDKFCEIVLDKYLDKQKEDSYQYNRLNFGDFIKAFFFSLRISKKIAYKHFENDFLNKLKSKTNKNLTISSLFQFIRRIEEETKGQFKKEIIYFLNQNKEQFIYGIKNEPLEKTTSGLIELTKCGYENYVDEFLYDTRKTILNKLKQIKGNKKIEKKVYADIRIVAINKSKLLLNEI